MGGGGTTTSQGTIDPTLQPLYRGSSNQLLAYQQQNPLTGYATPNPRGTAGLSPYESAGLQAMGGLFNASPWEALAAQSIMAAPGVARQGPTTGSYGYGGLQDMQSIYNMLGGGNPLQTRVNGGGYGSPAPPSGPPVAPPQPPPTGGPGGGGNPGPGGPGNPPVAQAMGTGMFLDDAFMPQMGSQMPPPSVTPNGQGGYQVSQSMTPPPGGGNSVNAQALRNFVIRSWESDQRRANRAPGSNAGIGGAGVDQWATQPFRGFDQYGIARSQGLGQHEGQGLGFVDPATGDYITRNGARPDEAYINSQMQSLLSSQGRSMADLDYGQTAAARMRQAYGLGPDGRPPGGSMSAEEAARLNAGYSRNFAQIQQAQQSQAGYAAQAAAHPANQPGAARFDSAGASQMPGGASQATTSAATGNAAGGSGANPDAPWLNGPIARANLQTGQIDSLTGGRMTPEQYQQFALYTRRNPNYSPYEQQNWTPEQYQQFALNARRSNMQQQPTGVPVNTAPTSAPAAPPPASANPNSAADAARLMRQQRAALPTVAPRR